MKHKIFLFLLGSITFCEIDYHSQIQPIFDNNCSGYCHVNGGSYTGNLDLSSYENCFVKLFVNRKTNPEMYGNLVERFYNNTNIHELIINEDTNDITQTVRVDTIDQGEDTLTFLGNYIEQVDTDLDKTKLKEFAKELYTEASE